MKPHATLKKAFLYIQNDHLTTKQIRSFFSRLRSKIKSAANQKQTQELIDKKVQHELVKELIKLKEKTFMRIQTQVIWTNQYQCQWILMMQTTHMALQVEDLDHVRMIVNDC